MDLTEDAIKAMPPEQQIAIEFAHRLRLNETGNAQTTFTNRVSAIEMALGARYIISDLTSPTRRKAKTLAIPPTRRKITVPVWCSFQMS